MCFNFENLDKDVRELMVEELELDVNKSRLYLSLRLNHYGQSEYPELLKKAMEDGDIETLANSLITENYWNMEEPRRTKKGIISCKVPRNAYQVLAEGEFNRFYIRALCRKAILENLDLEIYRAKHVRNHRSESEMIIGNSMDPKLLLEDLRINIGIDSILGVPPGPNSGLSIRIVN
jgi:hypothetical protein